MTNQSVIIIGLIKTCRITTALQSGLGKFFTNCSQIERYKKTKMVSFSTLFYEHASSQRLFKYSQTYYVMVWSDLDF